MIIVNGVAFFLCLTLWYIIKLLITVEFFLWNYLIADKYIQLYLYGFVSVLINSMINPFIYGTFNSRYRAALKRACSNCCTTGEWNHGKHIWFKLEVRIMQVCFNYFCMYLYIQTLYSLLIYLFFRYVLI